MKTKITLTSIIICFSAILSGAVEERKFDNSFLDPLLPMKQRVDILVDQMTLEEKITQMTHNSLAIPRLGIPEYGWWNEALHGVAYSGRATVFPQPIGLAASWNPQLVKAIGIAASDEARAKHHDFVRKGKRNNFQGLTFWAPNINIFRDPRWGRGIETYGEDPFLTGRMGVAYVQGLQGDDDTYLKLIATPKHYAVHSGPEPLRHEFDATCSDKDLYETYLPHFKEAIQEGGAYSIMSAYNRFNGESCSGHQRLLTDILRDEWGFEGYVVSDCAAIRDIFEYHKIAKSQAEAVAIGITTGCDLNCGHYYRPHLAEAIEQELITEDVIDVALKRLYLARFKLGMFDPEERVPYSKLGMDVVNSPSNQDLAVKAAAESVVLLKNENQTLPLSNDIKTIAVMGPNANDLEVLLGNYNGLPFEHSTPLAGIQKYAPDGCEVIFTQGADWAPGVFVVDTLPQGFLFTRKDGKLVEGMVGEYYASRYHEGDPAVTRFDEHIAFDWKDGSPHPDIPNDWFSIRWNGILKVNESGTYYLGGEAHHEFKIYIDGEFFVEEKEFYHQNKKKVAPIELEAGKEYEITVEFSTSTGDANFRMLWVPNNRNLVEDAVAAAEKADAVVLCMGLSPRLEGEEIKGLDLEGFYGGDRTDIVLPENQQAFIKTIAATGKPIVLVLLNGSALAINWEDENIPAIVEAWYPGQAAGEAIAQVLFGKYNPSGRLPVTFYKSVEDLPDFHDYNMTNRTYRYFTGEPLYPFGYGLSYSRFSYENLQLPEVANAGASVQLSVEVTNESDRAGDEVVQLYISNKRTDLDLEMPITALKGFKKVHLKANETKTVSFDLKPEAFAYVNEEGKSIIESGKFELSVGGILPGYSAATTESISKSLVLK